MADVKWKGSTRFYTAQLNGAYSFAPLPLMSLYFKLPIPVKSRKNYLIKLKFSANVLMRVHYPKCAYGPYCSSNPI